VSETRSGSQIAILLEKLEWIMRAFVVSERDINFKKLDLQS
jgi:hypothetical protein